MMYQATARVVTPDYKYTRLFGPKCATKADAWDVVYAEADKFWPGDKNPSRRAAFIGNCFISEVN